MTTLSLETANFENCFGKSNSTSRVDAIIHDNREYIIEYGTIFNYIWNDVVEIDSAIYLWLKDEAAKFYEDLDSAQKAQISDLLYDFLKENYNYEL